VQGRSPFDVDPQPIASLAQISLHAVAPLKRVYDRLLDRGFFEAQ
jgi:hypothetical protein